MTHGIIALVFLLVIAVGSAMIMKKTSIPYTIGLVAVGIGISWLFSHFPSLSGMQKLRLNQELIMYILLPALIFDSSINMDTKLLKKHLSPTLMLAGPGLVAATFITAAVLHWLIPISWGDAFLFGALISATDPVAVISLFEAVGAPKKLRILVDGESLFNDATAIVMFNIVSKIVIAGAAFSLNSVWQGALDFVLVFVGGTAVGAIIGYLVAKIIVFAQDDPLLEVAMSTIVAYMAFLVADKCFGFSGVMAVMGAGVVMAHYGATRFTPEVKQYMKNFWSFMSFVANSLIFLLLGFTEEILLLNKGEFIKVFSYVMAAVLAVQLARAAVVFGVCPWYGRKRAENKISLLYQLVMFWGGLRGAVPLALALGLPADLPGRELIMQITLGVVLFTVLIQGMTVKPLMGKLKLDQPDAYTGFTKILAEYFMKQKSIVKLNCTEFKAEAKVHSLDDLRQIYLRESGRLQQVLQEMIAAAPENINLVRHSVWLQAAVAERNGMEARFRRHVLTEGAYYRINAAIEAQLEWFLNQSGVDVVPPPMYTPKLKSTGWVSRTAAKWPLVQRWTWLRNYLKTAAAEDFSMLLCRQIGVGETLQMLETLQYENFYRQYSGVVEECVAYFKLLSEKLETQLTEIDRLNGNFMTRIAEDALHIMALGNELTILNTLHDSEMVNDEVTADLSVGKQAEIKDLTARIKAKIGGDIV